MDERNKEGKLEEESNEKPPHLVPIKELYNWVPFNNLKDPDNQFLTSYLYRLIPSTEFLERILLTGVSIYLIYEIGSSSQF
jgi:hypothetical protein|tara:strand:- start:642 stop:884 length:243 start_codon:yes stop_codon:yes gene_type:complete